MSGHIVSTTVLIRVQRARKSLFKAVEGSGTRPIFLLMHTWSYFLRRRRFNIFKPKETKFVAQLTLLSL